MRKTPDVKLAEARLIDLPEDVTHTPLGTARHETVHHEGPLAHVGSRRAQARETTASPRGPIRKTETVTLTAKMTLGLPWKTLRRPRISSRGARTRFPILQLATRSVSREAKLAVSNTSA